jgi:hypothetical protein
MTDLMISHPRQFIVIMGCCLQRLCFAHYFLGGFFGLRSSIGRESLRYVLSFVFGREVSCLVPGSLKAAESVLFGLNNESVRCDGFWADTFSARNPAPIKIIFFILIGQLKIYAIRIRRGIGNVAE